MSRRGRTQPIRETLKRNRQSARSAGLRYVNDKADAGIRRQRNGKHFNYIAPNGRRITGARTLRRIKALVIPPAWTEVWISTQSLGHLQATGRDQRGRKQYLYHDRWRAVREATKFDKMIDFAAALPSIRRRVNADLRLQGLPREKVLAVIVKLLETTLIRVGNEEYARINRTFGLTTMRNRHVAVNGTRVRFDFVGKSGIRHEIHLKNQQLASIVRKCQDLPGQQLFQYTDADAVAHNVSSNDVNQYLRDITGQDFTAKDFRTWTGTLMAMQSLLECEAADAKTAKRKNVTQAIKCVAQKLGNTVAVCRKSYIHPAIIKAYLEGTLPDCPVAGRQGSHLSLAERQMLSVLQRS
jgi:DNA topoisomerase-1